MPISETESAYKPIIYGQQTPIGFGQKEPLATVRNIRVEITFSGEVHSHSRAVL